jgi:hypothetical protein
LNRQDVWAPQVSGWLLWGRRMSASKKLKYGTATVGEVQAQEEIAHILSNLRDNFHVRTPAFDFVYDKDINLIIGLSPTWCWLHYINEKVGYFLPKSQLDRRGTVYFLYGAHHTEVFLKHCVSFDSVVQVAVDFFLAGEMSQVIEWEELK